MRAALVNIGSWVVARNCISWWGKTPGVAWTAADNKVLFHHTKNLCVGTVFEDEDDDGTPVVWRIVETRAGGNG